MPLPRAEGLPAPTVKAPMAVGEFELISRLKAVLDASPSDDTTTPLIGIGDDAAVVERDNYLELHTTDTLVDGVHFRTGEITWRDLGWKSMAVNQSDIAAMGGRPRYALVTLGLPPETDATDIEELYRGIGEACSANGGRCVGGDIVRSPVLFVTVSLTGESARRSDGKSLILRRDTMKSGDLIAVTGPLGSSAGGLRVLAVGSHSRDAATLRRSHFRPWPRVKEGETIAICGVEAAMDISDGLLADLTKMASVSGVNASVEADKVPVLGALKRLFPDDYLGLALAGGEDYELLFAAPPATMRRTLRQLGRGAVVIGEALPRNRSVAGRVRVTGPSGAEIKIARMGWDHLRDT